MSDVISKIWRTDEGKKRSFKNLKISMEKIEQEFSLLQDLGSALAAQNGGNHTLERAIRDSYLVHFRRIYNFLYTKDSDQKTITAADFFESADIWKTRRFKEPKVVRDFETLAANTLQSFTYGDESSIMGADRNSFKLAADEIAKVFNQFIELNLAVEQPEEPGIEGGVKEEDQPAKEETKITPKEYGGDEVLYRASLNPDGTLEVQVLHSNKSVQNLIASHQDQPDYFLTNLEKFSGHQQAARKWLAEVVADNKIYFEEGRVNFLMSE